jgi:glycosyltransferase involved in cell wall biosynthesis
VPIVSAIIPVHNGESTIARAVESVLTQDFSDIELIVVNDGSTDSTHEVLGPYAGQVKRIEQAKAGPAVARNVGIEAARGKYVAFLDADDAWLPGKLGALVAAIEQESTVVLAFSDLVPVDETGRVLAPSLISRVCAHAPSMDELLTRWWPILPSSVVVRRETLLECGGFDAGFRSPGYEDPLLWLLARERGEFRYVDQPLVLYRHAPLLQRMEKYVRGLPTFSERVQSHFGAAGARLMGDLVRAHLSALGHEGVVAMAMGDRQRARRAFRLALRHHPLHARSALRLMRTFLPPAIAGVLSSPRRRRRWAAQAADALGCRVEI